MTTEDLRRALAGEKGCLARPALRRAGHVQRGVEWKGPTSVATGAGLLEGRHPAAHERRQRGKAIGSCQEWIDDRVADPDADAIQEDEENPDGRARRARRDAAG